ncbi:lipopolysaccharide kinase [Aureitalea sp. L0-47]|uniref:lipopolysaccharide kinase InaA family protein n=1 Tax=Aureitalea sp. L0-47 TaxID=2816962 RepID=UPI0022377C58|nr:lipopolysaccharide kinase InaA family protein [Aureitalea sp. L0-47]MCW5520344.1 lipopolysaccharide kinase [Aureitalea sp. L0-47]
MAKTFVIHPDYKSIRPQLEEAINGFSENKDFITKGERNVIKKVKIGDEFFNIKKFKTPGLFQGLVYRFLRKSKARRSYEYALRLTELGINTPFPVCFSEDFSAGLKKSYYISRHLDYDFDFRVLNHNPKWPNRDEILRQVAKFTYELHENKVNFLDHSPGNTLIVDKGEEKYDFYLIDLNRMRFEPMSFEKRMRNFRRLWLSKHMINIMAETYANLSNNTYELTHSLMTKYSRAFQKKVNAKKVRRRRRNN